MLVVVSFGSPMGRISIVAPVAEKIDSPDHSLRIPRFCPVRRKIFAGIRTLEKSQY